LAKRLLLKNFINNENYKIELNGNKNQLNTAAKQGLAFKNNFFDKKIK